VHRSSRGDPRADHAAGTRVLGGLLLLEAVQREPKPKSTDQAWQPRPSPSCTSCSLRRVAVDDVCNPIETGMHQQVAEWAGHWRAGLSSVTRGGAGPERSWRLLVLSARTPFCTDCLCSPEPAPSPSPLPSPPPPPPPCRRSAGLGAFVLNRRRQMNSAHAPSFRIRPRVRRKRLPKLSSSFLHVWACPSAGLAAPNDLVSAVPAAWVSAVLLQPATAHKLN
jgi:hypothetical protein